MLRIVSGLFFFPRGGSSHLARSLSRSLGALGDRVTLAVGSLGDPGGRSHASTFYDGIEVVPVDYTPAAACRSSPRTRTGRTRPIRSSRSSRTRRTSGSSSSGARRSRARGRNARTCSTCTTSPRSTRPRCGASPTCRSSPSCTGPSSACCARSTRARRGPSPRTGPSGCAAGRRARGSSSSLPGSPTRRPSGWRSRVGDSSSCRAASTSSSSTGARSTATPSAPLARGGAAGLGRVGDPRHGPVRGGDLADSRRAPGRALRRALHRRQAAPPPPPRPRPRAGRARRADPARPRRRPSGRVRGRASVELAHPGVFLAGWHGHDDLADAINASDLVVLPSRNEAFGLVLAEAMACGVPVVATASEGPSASSTTGTPAGSCPWTTRTRSSTRLPRRSATGPSGGGEASWRTARPCALRRVAVARSVHETLARSARGRAVSPCAGTPRRRAHGGARAPVVAAARGGAEAPTWNSDVGRIVLSKCAGCHTTGGIAPFALTSARDARRHVHGSPRSCGRTDASVDPGPGVAGVSRPGPATADCGGEGDDRGLGRLGRARVVGRRRAARTAAAAPTGSRTITLHRPARTRRRRRLDDYRASCSTRA